MHILGWIVPPRSLTPRFTCLYTFRSYLESASWRWESINNMIGLNHTWCSLMGNERIKLKMVEPDGQRTVLWDTCMNERRWCLRWEDCALNGTHDGQKTVWDTCMNERRWCCLWCIRSDQIDRWQSLVPTGRLLEPRQTEREGEEEADRIAGKRPD
jgi:hypothetical protein